MSDELYQGEQMSTPEPNPKPNDLPARETQERVRAQEEGQARDVEWWALHRRVLVEVYHRPHQLRAAALALGLEE